MDCASSCWIKEFLVYNTDLYCYDQNFEETSKTMSILQQVYLIIYICKCFHLHYITEILLTVALNRITTDVYELHVFEIWLDCSIDDINQIDGSWSLTTIYLFFTFINVSGDWDRFHR
jgi:hypothetical protein